MQDERLARGYFRVSAHQRAHLQTLGNAAAPPHIRARIARKITPGGPVEARTPKGLAPRAARAPQLVQPCGDVLAIMAAHAVAGDVLEQIRQSVLKRGAAFRG